MNDEDWEKEKVRTRALSFNYFHKPGEGWRWGCPMSRYSCTWSAENGYGGISGGWDSTKLDDEGNLDRLRKSVEDHQKYHGIDYSPEQRCPEKVHLAATEGYEVTIQCQNRLEHYGLHEGYQRRDITVKWPTLAGSL